MMCQLVQNMQIVWGVGADRYMDGHMDMITV
jgi:hypothetical protein